VGERNDIATFLAAAESCVNSIGEFTNNGMYDIISTNQKKFWEVFWCEGN
jgi:hypothetical protein